MRAARGRSGVVGLLFGRDSRPKWGVGGRVRGGPSGADFEKFRCVFYGCIMSGHAAMMTDWLMA